MNVVYLSDGSPRKIKVGNQNISFKRTSPKNLAVNQYLSGLIIQGLKGIGEGKVDASHISQIKKIAVHLSAASQIKINLRFAPVWIQKILQKILNDLNKI